MNNTRWNCSVLDLSLLSNRHDNVVRCYGARSDESGDRQFIFLEYCAGGELFDKIGERGKAANCINHGSVLMTIIVFSRARGGDARAPGSLLLHVASGCGGKCDGAR